MMREAFGAQALVEGFDDLIPDMRCDPKDRHVLAAVRGGADAIVTFNLEDFPDEAVAAHGIKTLHQDYFLLQLLAEHPATVMAVLEDEITVFRIPQQTSKQFLASLTPTVPTFANLAADAYDDPPVTISAVPALVGANEEDAFAALGRAGDLTDPARVGLTWWAGLLSDLARQLTYPPPSWATTSGRSATSRGDRASKVIRAVDAPEGIALMRFVPDGCIHGTGVRVALHTRRFARRDFPGLTR